MDDRLLTTQDREEALSRVYTRAVAAGAGYTVRDCDFDRDGIDLQIQAGGELSPALDLQLKATVNLAKVVDSHRGFALKRRNYDLLRKPSAVPRLLVVLDLPKKEDRWLTITPEQLVMRHCAYWMNLVNSPITDNQHSITVKIPRCNVFNIEALHELMDLVREGKI